MKTININLIDDQTKESNKSKIEILTDDSDINPKVKFAAIAIIASVCIVFATSFGIWFISNMMLDKTGQKLTELKSEHEQVSLELSKSTSTHRDLLNEKKILETKFLAQNLVDSSLLPWHKILVEISSAVPKDIKVTEISKTTETSNSDQRDIITIKGEAPSVGSKSNSLKSISFFILNIDNGSMASNLEKSTVRKIDFDSKANIYNFEIASTLKTLEKSQKK